MVAPRAVLLDIDGTLVDSNDAHAAAWAKALGHLGHDVAYDRVRALIGKGGDKLLAEVAGIDSESPHGKEIEKLREQTFMRDYLPRLKPFPKARDLLMRMRDGGLCLVVATSARRSQMHALLDICEVADLIHAYACGDDAESSKPDPDIVQAALQRVEIRAGESLMLGDTPYDVDAASRCGVGTVAVRSGGWDDAALAGALGIYDDVADLLAHYGNSPFSRSAG